MCVFCSTFDKSCQLLDLGKYLQQQAELTKQKRELKKRKKLNDEAEESTEAKRPKKSHSETQKRTSSSVKPRNVKSKKTGIAPVDRPLDQQLPVKDESTTSEQGPIQGNIPQAESKIAKIEDGEVSESGSEYVPSDEDSGKNKQFNHLNKFLFDKIISIFTDDEKGKSRSSKKRHGKNNKNIQKSLYNF